MNTIKNLIDEHLINMKISGLSYVAIQKLIEVFFLFLTIEILRKNLN